jgi:hypothetical protein
MRQLAQQQMLQRTDPNNMLLRQQFGNGAMGMQPNGMNMAKQAMQNSRNT